MIPYGRQDISSDDIKAVISVLKSDFLTQGPVLPAFEQSLASVSTAKYAVAVNSATSALHIACLALGVGANDIVWTSPITFVASANCARLCGAEIDFVDIDADTFNISPEALRLKLEKAREIGRLPKVIIPVHMCGQSPDMKEISELAREFNFRIIEDASHAIGASYAESPVGSCEFSDITVFSFHPVKIITTAEGGAAVTNSIDLAGKMQELRSHAITRNEDRMEKPSHGPWYYEQLGLGLNYRMTEVQAALGLSQLSRLSEFVATRNALANEYDKLLAELPILLPGREKNSRSSFHLYVIRLLDSTKRRYVFEKLRNAGIGVNVHYIPVHLQPYYENLGFRTGDFPKSEDYYSRAISVPLFASMSDQQQHKVVEELASALAE